MTRKACLDTQIEIMRRRREAQIDTQAQIVDAFAHMNRRQRRAWAARRRKAAKEAPAPKPPVDAPVL
jgi:hypothetical protein